MWPNPPSFNLRNLCNLRILNFGLPLRVFPSILDKVGPNIVDTVLSFCHYALNDDSLLGLLPYLTKKGVGVINASPTGMGLLTPQGAPAWHPARKLIIDGCRTAVEYCQKQGIDIVKLTIQFACSQPDIATTLVSTARPSNIRDNISYVEEPIDEGLLGDLLEVLKPIHNFNFTRGRLEHRDLLVGPGGESDTRTGA